MKKEMVFVVFKISSGICTDIGAYTKSSEAKEKQKELFNQKNYNETSSDVFLFKLPITD